METVEIFHEHDNLYRVGKEWVARSSTTGSKWKRLTEHGALSYDSFSEAVGKSVEAQID